MVLVLNIIFSTVHSTLFEMPSLHLFTNWNIFCVSAKKKTMFSQFVASLHALPLQSLLFQNVVSHMFHSHVKVFTCDHCVITLCDHMCDHMCEHIYIFTGVTMREVAEVQTPARSTLRVFEQLTR